jgi:Type II secretion system protein B
MQPAPEPPATPRSRSERPAGVIEPMPQPRTPSPSAARAAPGDRGKLKLEVVSYSDTPAQRLVFISGRKYVEGDTTEGGFRVEQIKEDSVVLSDQGVRFTLR